MDEVDFFEEEKKIFQNIFKVYLRECGGALTARRLERGEKTYFHGAKCTNGRLIAW